MNHHAAPTDAAPYRARASIRALPALARAAAVAALAALLAAPASSPAVAAEPRPAPSTSATAERDADAERHASYRAHLAAAEKSLRLDEARELRRWLAAAPAGLRGWEWHHLDAIADTSTAAVARPTAASGLSVSADGTRIAAIEGDTVQILSLPDLEPVASITGHDDAIYRASFDPSGSRIVTVSRDVTSRVWDATTGAELARIDLHNPAFAAATFGPDGRRAATCAWMRDDDGAVHGVVWIWDPATGRVVHRVRVGIKPLSAIAFTPDGTRILVGSWDGVVHELDAEAREVRRLALPDDGIYNAVNDIAVSADGSLLAVGTKDRTVRVLELGSGEVIATLRGSAGFVNGVRFSPDGSLLAAACGDATVRLWSTRDWTAAATLRGHTGTVRDVAWSRDGDRVYGCSADGTIRAWARDAERSAALRIDVGEDGTYTSMLSPDGSTVAVACFSGEVVLFDSRTGARTGGWTAHPGSSCNTLAIASDGTTLVTCSWDQTARIWNLPDASLQRTLEFGRGVYTCDVSPDGGTVALAGGPTLELWSATTGERVFALDGHADAVSDVSFSPDGRWLVSSSADGTARVWDVGTGSCAHVLDADGAGVRSAAFSADGRSLIAGCGDGSVRSWSLDDGRPLRSIDTGDSGLAAVAIQPCGRRVAAVGDGLFVVDLAGSGDVTMHQPTDGSSLWHLSWSPDGRRLATCTTNGTVSVLGSTPPRSD